MLPQIHRLKEKKDFQNLFRSGKRLGAGPFELVFARNQLDVSRFGVIVRKSFGKAVKRNRAKRIGRHMAEGLGKKLRPPCDIVILPRKGFLDEDMEVLKEVLKKKLRESLKKTEGGAD